MFEYDHGSVLLEILPKGISSTTAAVVLATTGILAYLVFFVLTTDAAQKKDRMKAVITPFSLPSFCYDHIQPAPILVRWC